MRVYPNAPAYPSQGVHNELDRPTHFRHEGIPIRLAIAAQIMAGFAAWSGNRRDDFIPEEKAVACSLNWADALIAEYNKGCKT